MKLVFEEVALLCPEGFTGGPEALHQLSYMINSLGGTAGLAYYGGRSAVNLAGNAQQGTLMCSIDPERPTQKAYEKYRPRTISEMALNANKLLIFPEILVSSALAVPFCQRAIWWLSVDNSYISDPRINYQSYRDGIFGDSTLMHFYQSDYAREFLAKNRARNVYPLFDYTDEIFLESAKMNINAKKDQIAFFPRKGAELARELITAAPGLHLAPIENMSRTQVKETLENSAIYIDFGHHPGKDRVPREAAVSGAVVLLHDKGAGSIFADHPLDRDYLFSLADIRDGRLLSRINEILANYGEHFARQRYYRHKVRLEKEEFCQQVKTFFFDEC